jgi:hypothetical protein
MTKQSLTVNNIRIAALLLAMTRLYPFFAYATSSRHCEEPATKQSFTVSNIRIAALLLAMTRLYPFFASTTSFRHCEERYDEAISYCK